MTAAAIQLAQSFEFTAEQQKMIRDSFLNGATTAEANVLMELARLRRLNPITKQIHFVKRWDSQKQREVWSAQVGIDGFRAIAERTGKYAGQDEPEFEYDAKGAIKLCRVKVYRSDWQRPAVGLAHFSEYAQTKKDGSFTQMWKEKPHVMVAKCAEALGFRKAFPEDLSGLYTPEEMGSEPEEKDVTPTGFERVVIQMPAETATAAQEITKMPEQEFKTQTENVKALLRARAGMTQEKVVQTAWGRLLEVAKTVNIDLARLKAITKDATGKGKPAELTEDDERMVMERIKSISEPEPGSEG